MLGLYISPPVLVLSISAEPRVISLMWKLVLYYEIKLHHYRIIKIDGITGGIERDTKHLSTSVSILLPYLIPTSPKRLIVTQAQTHLCQLQHF